MACDLNEILTHAALLLKYSIFLCMHSIHLKFIEICFGMQYLYVTLVIFSNQYWENIDGKLMSIIDLIENFN